MSDKVKVYLHIGTHKTGTTSIQTYLLDNKDHHHAKGIDFYQGLHLDNNHVEFHMAAMKDGRTSPFKEMNRIQVDPAYRSLIQARVGDFLSSTKCKKAVFSAEGLSYLRYQEELSFLSQMFKEHEVYIILYLREKTSFLKSYQDQLLKVGFTLSDDPSSFAYVNDDSWLTDYQSLIRVYANTFGWDHLIIQSYDNAIENDGNVLPSFLSAIGLSGAGINIEKYWLNRSGAGQQHVNNSVD